MQKRPDIFTRFTSRVSTLMGRSGAFISALALLLIWALAGPFCHFSATWQLVINTSTTIITFLAVFIIQNAQNRDALAFNMKLNAIIKELGITDDELCEAEDMSDKDLESKKEEAKR